MFLRQFKYLIAVVEERHFGRAADRCNVTQPSLSAAIKQLELEIGAPIFLRGRGQRFQGLTAEGEKVTRWARGVISNCQAMREEIASMSNNLQGKLRIGAMPSMSPVLPSLLSRVREKHPGIVIDITFIGNEKMRVGLNEFSLDAAFTYMEASDMGRRNTRPIYSEKLSLLVPDTEEFADRTTITWKEASELPIAMLRSKLHERTFVDSIFEKSGCQPQPKVVSESILHLMFQVQHAGLCTIIPSHFATLPGTRALDLVNPVATQEIALFWAEGESVLPMVKALVTIIKQMTASGELTKHLEKTQHPTMDGDPAKTVRIAKPAKAEKPASKPRSNAPKTDASQPRRRGSFTSKPQTEVASLNEVTA